METRFIKKYSSKQTTFRVPQEILDGVSKAAKQEKTTKTQIWLQVMKNFLIKEKLINP